MNDHVAPQGTGSLPEELLKFRETMVNRILRGLLVIAILGVPASVSRAFDTGWLLLYDIHIAAGIVAILVNWFRDRIPFNVKAALIIAGLWVVGVIAVVTLGVLGTGYMWLIMAGLLLSTLYSVRAGVISSAVTTLLFMAAAWAFNSGLLKVFVDANSYIVTWHAWSILIVTAVFMPIIVFQAVAAYQKNTVVLLETVQRQNAIIEKLATHDHLTGLPSLNLARDRLAMAIHAAQRSKKKVALLFIDLDDFKKVNDTLGHDAGDHVLKHVAKCLRSATRAEDTAARIGGDEFIAIAGGVTDGQVAAGIAERAIALISQPIEYLGSPISIGASVGIALFPDHAGDAESLLKAADTAMYQVKKGGKNRFAFAPLLAAC